MTATAPQAPAGRIYILPTRQGLFFLLLLFGLLIGSVNYNSNLGFLLTFLLGAMAFVSLAYTHRNLKGVRVASASATSVFAGETAVFRLRLQARWQQAWAIRLRFAAGDAACCNPPAGGLTVALAVAADRRGVLQPGPLTVSTRYPFGIFRSYRRLEVDARCLVFPRPRWGAFPAAGDGDGGSGGGRTTAAGVDDFKGLRSYQPGDSLRHVYWKAFSRGQGLLVKDFGSSGARAIRLEWDAVPGAGVEERLGRLCHMVLQAHRQQLTYGLNLPGRSIAPARGMPHRQACLQALALYGG